MRIFLAAICLAIVLLAGSPIQVLADDMTLRSRDGSITLDGEFRSFDGRFYRIETDLGVLTVDGDGVFCEGPACPDLDNYFDRVRIAGSQVVLSQLMVPIAQSFAQHYGFSFQSKETSDGVQVVFTSADDEIVGELALVRVDDNADALELLHNEAVDITMSPRALSDMELERSITLGVADFNDPIRSRVVALDALVPVVNDLNSLRSISLDDTQALLEGEVTNWARLTGRNAPVALYLHQDTVSGLDGVKSLLGVKQFSDRAVVLSSEAELSEALKGDPYAFGLARRQSAQNLQALELSGACGYATLASILDVKTGDFPLVQPVQLLTPSRRLPALARDFVKFATSPNAQAAIARGVFVDQGVDEIPLAQHGRRMANALAELSNEADFVALRDMAKALQNAKRLSLGFRFEDGSSNLNAQSKSNAIALAELIDAGVFDGRDLMFIGFSDAAGESSANQALSLKRAARVRDLVKTHFHDPSQDEVSMSVQGAGELMPLACNDNSFGRALNRRVEVWVSR